MLLTIAAFGVVSLSFLTATSVSAGDPATCTNQSAATVVASCQAGYKDPNIDCSKDANPASCEQGKKIKKDEDQLTKDQYCEKNFPASVSACKQGQNGGDCDVYTSQGTQNLTKEKQACEAGASEGNKAPASSSGQPTTGGGAKVSADGGDCGGAKTSIIDCGDKKGEEAIGDLLKQFVTVLSVGVGIIAVGSIVFASILYASARDNSGQTQQAITMIRNTVIGILLYIFMVAIVNWLVPGGVIT